jgi:hypothetical protein
MIYSYNRIRVLVVLAGLTLLASCNTVSYVDQGNVETVGINKADHDPFSRNVIFHLDRAFYETPPDCVMILPAKVPKGTDRKVGHQIDDAVRRHLNGYLDKVIDARRVRAQARQQALDLNHPGDLARFGRTLRCDSYVEVHTEGVNTFYAVVWTNISFGIRMTLKRAKDGHLLWRGAHTAERMDGGLPLSFLGIGAGIFNAGRLASDQDVVPSIIDDSLRRTLVSLPDMRRN